jgi:hypothetical protein
LAAHLIPHAAHATAMASAAPTLAVARTPERTRALGRALACVLAAISINALAQAVTDPTRAPASLLPPRAADADNAPLPAEHGVRMIVRGPGEVRAALLGDTLVRAGDHARWNGADVRVVAITDASVVIARAGKRETIELLPDAAHAVRCTRARDASAPC